MSTRHIFRLATVAAGALALSAALTGCSLIQGAVDQGVEDVIEGTTGGDVELPGGDLPDDFPADVPLLNDDIVFGAGIGDGTAKVWNVSVAVADDTAYDEIVTQLEGAGFTTTEFSGSTADGRTGAFASDTWTVLVVVADDGSGTWTANYTVSTAEAQ